ncbi:MAG: class I adenylate-forming enzyme family protein, partial [Pseudomonadota bacterium]
MEPCPSPFNLSQYVLAKAEAQPDKIALAILGPSRAERWSYGKLASAVRATGAYFLSQGLQPGDQLLMRLGNGVAFPLAYLGAIAVGIIPIPTSAQLTTPELDTMLGKVTPRAMVLGPGLAAPSAKLQSFTEDELLEGAKGEEADFLLGDPERLAYIIFTSGTSGAPKAVAHAHRAIWARRMMFDGWYGIRPDDRLLHAGALNWTFTLGTGLLDPWATGATALIPAEGTATEALPLLLARHDATLFAAAPGVLRKLLKEPGKLELPKLRHTLTAGEHLHASLREAWQSATGKGLYDAFGMTECSTFLSANPSGTPSLSVQKGRKIRLQDDGTIAIHKDEQGLMLGYLEGGKPALPLTNEHFLTADKARWNPDGSLTYEGRASDLLNAGGYRVSPVEVETALAALDGIDEIAVAEVPVKDTSILAAFYTGPAPLVSADIEAYAAARLARYKQPRAYIHLQTLPRGPNGKLARRALPAL